MVIQNPGDARKQLINERINLVDEVSKFDELISKQEISLAELDDLIEELRAIRRRVLEINSQLAEPAYKGD